MEKPIMFIQLSNTHPNCPNLQIVNHLKGVSSRLYGAAGYKKPDKTSLWSPSYFVASVGGAPLETLKKYI